MKVLQGLLITGLLTSVFASGLNISIDADRKNVSEKKTKQQIAQERRDAERRRALQNAQQRKTPQQIARERRDAQRNRQGQDVQYQRNAIVDRRSANQNTAPARYNERYGRYNQGNDARDYRGPDRRLSLNNVNNQIQQSRQNLNRSQEDVRMYQADLNFFTDKRNCIQRARGPRELDRCEQNFR